MDSKKRKGSLEHCSRKDQFEIDQSSDMEKCSNPRGDDDCFTKFISTKLFIILIIASTVLITLICVALLVNYEINNEVIQSVNYVKANLPPEQQIWFDKGIEELKAALNHPWHAKRAKNTILFVGDGMGPNTVTAARILKYKEEGLMTWERFPHLGMLKTYCANKQVPDSFSTATALFGGVKVNYETGGVDSSVHLANCSASLDSSHHVQSILQWAQADGMNTGFVTTTRVTHATPAALYAHVPDRRWECESKIPNDEKSFGCKDIARILVEDKPGKNINVIMGGGRQCMISNVNGSEADPIDLWACYSTDGRNLISEWEGDKKARGVSYSILSNNSDLNNFDPKNTDYVLGIFANGHLKYDYQRDAGPSGMPSLQEMTIKALEVLTNKDDGFLLVVEGGNIDQAHHRGSAKKAISETLALDDAVKGTIKFLKEKLDDTLVIVTADHSHTLTINGYPDRGNDIFGIASKSRTDSIPYTTLTYGTGYKGYQVEIDKTTGFPKRTDPSLQDTKSYDYIQQAAVYTDENTHGGSDVTVYALGPMAHLFHKMHEQTYVAHVISYALRIGRFSDNTIVESVVDFLGL